MFGAPCLPCTEQPVVLLAIRHSCRSACLCARSQDTHGRWFIATWPSLCVFWRRAGSDWAEDSDFAARLDEGWDLNVVREACYQAVMSVGREAMHFRPPEEQNDHKVTCGVLATQAAVVQVTSAALLAAQSCAYKPLPALCKTISMLLQRKPILLSMCFWRSEGLKP